MFEIKVASHFSAAHRLRNYRGSCEGLHGHNWKVEVSFIADELNNQGLLVDFRLLKRKLNKVLKGLDHKYLNDLTCFKKRNPTSENIAKYIYERLSFVDKRISKRRVTVWETDTASATYYE